MDYKQLKTFSLPLLYFVAIWFVPIWIYCHFASLVLDMYASIRTTPFFLLDVCKFYVCGLMARSPQYLSNLYNPDVQAAVFGNLLHIGTTFTPPSVPGLKVLFTPNEYTPTFNILMIPATCLSLRQFIIIWELLILSLATLSITIVLKRQGQLKGYSLLGWWLVVLCSYHLYLNIKLGQTAFLITGLIGLFFVGLAENRTWLMAITLTIIAIFKPQFTIVPLIAALWGKRYKALVTALIIGCLVLAATISILGWQPVIDYPKNFASIQAGTASGRYYYTTEGMGNLLSALIIAFGAELGYKLSYPVMLLGWLCCVLIWRSAFQAGPLVYRYALAVTMPLALVTSAHANDFDLVILIVGWAITISALTPAQIKLLRNPYERFWCYLFLLYPIIDGITIQFAFGAPYNLPLTIVVIVSAYLLFRSKLKQTIDSTKSSG